MATSFGIAETDDYVRKILAAAGKPPKGAGPDRMVQWLLPHVIHQESRGNPKAVSKVGAVGVMQTMPATLKDPGFGVAPAKDDSDAERFRVGKDYLTAMVKRYPGRPDLALAAYNAGPGRADKWGNVHVTSDSVDASPAGLKFRESAGLAGAVGEASELGGLPTQEDKPKPTFRDFFTDVVGVDSGVGAIVRMAEDMGYHADPNFDIGAIPKDQWTKITQGIPEDLQPGLGGAVSLAHLQLMAERTRAQLRAEEELASFGGWGVAGRLAMGALDPVNVAVGVATGGLGAGVRAERLAEAARTALAAKDFAEAHKVVDVLGDLAKAGKWSGAGRVFVAAGAENAALTQFINQDNITRDGWDVVNAAVTGGLLGAGASRAFRGRELTGVRHAYLAAREELHVAELNHTLETQRSEIETRLRWLHADGDVAKAKAQLREVEANIAKARDAHAQELAAAATARREGLTKTAAGALKRSELGQLSRTVDGLRKQAKGADTLEAEVRSRMHAEDVESLGEAEANTKARTKLRNGAAKKEATARLETIRTNLRNGETALARAHAAQDALTELRKIERRAKSHPGDHLMQLDEPGRNAFAEKEQAMASSLEKTLAKARGTLKSAEDAVTAARTDLESRLSGLDAARQAGVQAIDKGTMEAAQAFGPDTASAARFMGFNEGVHPHLEDDSGLPKVARMGAEGTRGKIVDMLTARKGPLATFSMILRGSPNETVREQVGLLVGNAIGNADGSVNQIGASEIGHMLRVRYETKFSQAMEHAYKDWAERNGIGMMQRQTRLAREDFMSSIGRHIRGDLSHNDPAVVQAAGKLRKIFAEYVKDAKEAGVKGFEELEARDDYLPRVFDFHSLKDIQDRIGSDSLRLLVQKAIQASNDDMSDQLASKISRAYVETMKNLRVGANVGMMHGFKWDDVGFLRQFLHDAGTPSEEIEHVVNEMAALNARRQRQTEGTARYAKHRVQLDENFGMKFRDQVVAKEGRIEDVEVRMADLFENNVEALFGRYNRTMAGHVGLAKIGIKSKKDFDLRIQHVERALEDDLDELNRVKETSQAAYALITGTPIEDASTLTRLGRAARDYNFTTTMGQSGWAQFPDLAGLLQSGYLKTTMAHLPEIFRTMRRSDGKIDLEFYRELESWSGLGTDLFNNRVFSSYDWGVEGEGFTGVAGKVEHGLRVAGRGVTKASGLGFMTEMSQRLAGRVIIQRLVKDVLEGGKLAEHRALQLGLDDAMKARIAKQLKDHTEWVDGDFGGKVRIVNYSAWKDVDARDAMLYAVSREARRMVQEEDLGDTTLWMHKSWGKIISQFRRFALVSYSKQLLYGIAHADAEEGTRLMISMALAAAAYKARHETALALKQAGGMSDEDAEKYREKYLTLHRLAAASIANSSYSSVLPGLWDQGQYTFTGTRSFDTRSSGLDSDLLGGIPTVGLGKNVLTALSATAQSAVRGDKQFDKKDAAAIRRLLPFQNVIGMDLPFSALTSGLPDKDQDADPESLDFGFNDNPQPQ